MKERKKCWKKILTLMLVLSMAVGIMPLPMPTATVKAALPVVYESDTFNTTGRNVSQKESDNFRITMTNPWDDGFVIGKGSGAEMYATVISLRDYKIEKMDVILAYSCPNPPKVNGNDGVYENPDDMYHAKYTFTDLNTTSAKISAAPGSVFPYVEKVVIYYTAMAVSLDRSTMSLIAGGGASPLKASLVPSYFTNQKLKWSVTSGSDYIKLYSDFDCTNEVGTSATDLKTVYVNGSRIGSATIKIVSDADSSKTATCTVTVNGTKQPTPEGVEIIGDGYRTFRLTGLKKGMQVKVNLNGQNWVTPTLSSTGEYEVVIPNNVMTDKFTVYVKNVGDNIVTIDSSNLTVNASHAAKPSLTVTQPESFGDKGKVNTVSGIHEYSTDYANVTEGEGTWNACTTDMEFEQGTTVAIRAKASGSALASENQIVEINRFEGTKEATPAAVFTATDTNKGTLTNVSDGMRYSVNGGETWKGVSGSSIEVTSVTTEAGIKVFMPGNGTTTKDSDVQTIQVTRAARPDLTVTQPTTISGKGSVAATTDHEYSTNGTSWTACSGVLENLEQGSTLYVRVKPSGTTLASVAQYIVIGRFEGKKETTPTASFEADGIESGKLSGLTSNAVYIISGAGLSTQEITADADGKYTLASGLTRGGLSLIKKGDGDYTTDSEAQTITITAADTPKLTVNQPTTITGKGNAATTNIHEYSTDGTSWTACGGALNNLAQGSTLYIRVKANGTELASGNQTVTINTFTGEQEKKPNAVFTAKGADRGELTGLVSNAKYLVSGAGITGSEVTADADGKISFSSGITAGVLSLVKKGDGEYTTDSQEQTITITKAEVPTTPGAADCTKVENNDGKLTGVTAAMEYKKSGAQSWTAGTGEDITGLAFGIYEVRVAANKTTLASDSKSLTIKKFISYTVTFKVTNGSWNDDTKTDKTVTLTGHEGDTLKLAGTDIPAVGTKPTEGCKAGSWEVAPDTTTAITKATTYTYIYEEKMTLASFAVKLEGWIYGGTANTPSVSGNQGNGEPTYTYYTDEACTKPTTTATGAEGEGGQPVNAGTYYIKAGVPETEDYKKASASAGFTISKASNPAVIQPSTTALADGKTAFDLSKLVSKAEGTVTFSTNAEGFRINGSSLVIDDEVVGDTKGKVTVTVTAEENSNYESTSSDVEITVTKLAIQSDFAFADTSLTKTYGSGNFTVTASGAVEGSSVTYAVTDGTDVVKVDENSGEVTILKVGKATITATASEVAALYAMATTSYQVTIDPKSITIPKAKENLKYTGQTQTGVESGDDYNVTEGQSAANTGNYTAVAELKDKNNTKWNDGTTENKSITWKIAKAEISIQAEDKSSKYGETLSELTWKVSGDYVKGDDLGVVVEMNATSGSGTDGSALPANVGTYPIKLSWNENANYNAKLTEGIYTISKKAVTVTAEAKTITYGDEEAELTYEVTGLVKGDSKENAFTGTLKREEGTDAGTYLISIGTLAAKNYDISFTGADYVIEKASQGEPQEQLTISEAITANGSISGLDATKTYEYSADHGKTWTAVTGKTTIEVSPGTYEIRYAEDANHEAGSAITVTVEKKDDEKKDGEIELALYEGLKISQNSSRIRIQWGKSKEADGYELYICYCGKNLNKVIKTIKSNSKTSVDVKKLDGKKINLKKNFKLYVVAYKMVNGKKVRFAKTVTAHVVGLNNYKCSNVKKIKVAKSNITIKVGKTEKISAKTVLSGKSKKQLSNIHTSEFRYASTNRKVATVNSKGKVKGISKGSCYVYVYARNGHAKKIKVKVK